MENEIIFANTTIFNEQLYSSYVKDLYKKNIRNRRVLAVAWSVLLFLYLTITINFKAGIIGTISYYVILPLFGILFTKIYVTRASANIKKKMKNWTEANYSYKYDFFIDSLICNNSDTQMEFNYNNITELQDSKECFVLLFGANSFFIDKNSFTSGDVKDFESFLKLRNSNIQVTKLLKKNSPKKKKIILTLLAASVILIAYLFIKTQLNDSKTKIFYKENGKDIDIIFNEITENENGLIEIIYPKNLFGSDTKSAAALKYDFVHSEYFDWRDRYSEIVVNEDGTLSFFYTRDQYEAEKKRIYQMATMDHFINPLSEGYIGMSSIKEVIFENEALTRITVFVSIGNTDKLFFLDKTLTGLGLCLYVGPYQLLLGADPNEWHTTIIVKNIDTDKIISEIYYPNDKMYFLN